MKKNSEPLACCTSNLIPSRQPQLAGEYVFFVDELRHLETRVEFLLDAILRGDNRR